MKIISINIQNIKGIQNETFKIDLIPNKPCILVAPNGFGKTSLLKAFSSLQRNRINLATYDHYMHNISLEPVIAIKFSDEFGETETLTANSSSNLISPKISYFCIGTPLSKQPYFKLPYDLKPIVLIEKIPACEDYGYMYDTQKSVFGKNSSILPDISKLLMLPRLLTLLPESTTLLYKINQSIKEKASITYWIDKINQFSGNSDTILQLAENAGCFSKCRCFIKFKTFLKSVGVLYKYDIEYFLAGYQILILFQQNKVKFVNATKYALYQIKKTMYTEVIKNLNSTRFQIMPNEINGKLIVEFPHSSEISNGQRDILCFIVMLQKAKSKLTKHNSILIIDEIFDYLDDANLIAVQYYITQFIQDFKESSKNIFPIILTHLDPSYFKSYVFKKQAICYLEHTNLVANHHVEKLLRVRSDRALDQTLKDDISKYLLHYHYQTINRRTDFKNIGLKETWGEGYNFYMFIYNELEKYSESKDYDPLAVCCAVRILIEKEIYLQFNDEIKQAEFIAIHKTNSKLLYALKNNISVPEIYFLLGIIYNDALHLKENQEFIIPIVTKLKNTTIKYMITQLLNSANVKDAVTLGYSL